MTLVTQLVNPNTPCASATLIDGYANSMFRFERLHQGWIHACADYLKHIFGASLQGKTVVDYAFGRGNWSLAFLEAGASHVYAIDASQSNVHRFREYCSEHGIAAVEVIYGNVLEDPIQLEADILWLYGILPNISDEPLFLSKVLQFVTRKEAMVLAYGYNAGSLREWVVERSRAILRYHDEDAFRRDSLKFTPAARLRARDDLTASIVRWHTLDALTKSMGSFGWHSIKQVADFKVVTMGHSEAEFAPHHLLFTKNGLPEASLKEPASCDHGDLEILDALWTSLTSLHDLAANKELAISLFNVHFSSLGAKGEAEMSLLQIYLFLLYGLRMHGLEPKDLSGLAAEAFAMGIAAISNAARPSMRVKTSFLMSYLSLNTIRI